MISKKISCLVQFCPEFSTVTEIHLHFTIGLNWDLPGMKNARMDRNQYYTEAG